MLEVVLVFSQDGNPVGGVLVRFGRLLLLIIRYILQGAQESIVLKRREEIPIQRKYKDTVLNHLLTGTEKHPN